MRSGLRTGNREYKAPGIAALVLKAPRLRLTTSNLEIRGSAYPGLDADAGADDWQAWKLGLWEPGLLGQGLTSSNPRHLGLGTWAQVHRLGLTMGDLVIQGSRYFG